MMNPDLRFMFIGSREVTDEIRMKPIAECLHEKGLPSAFKYVNEVTLLDINNFDVFILLRPISRASQMLYQALKQSGKFVTVDLDDDFFSIPNHHPGYKTVGPGNQQAIDGLKYILQTANHVTVTHEQLMNRMIENGAQNVTIIPNGWSRKNPLWLYRKKNVHRTIGWCGTATHRMDFNECKRAIEELSKEKDFDIVIGGDYEIYDRINMPPHRKIFLPFTSYDNYPWMLGWMDIMLVPLRTDQFNLGKSDIKLVDAAAKGIPYVASDVPQYRDHKGGIVVDTKDSWKGAIADLLDHHELVDRHVSEMFEFAQERENDNIALMWMKMLGEIL